MKKLILVTAFAFLALAIIASAQYWTPDYDANFRCYYALWNVTNITVCSNGTILFYDDGYIVAEDNLYLIPENTLYILSPTVMEGDLNMTSHNITDLEWLFAEYDTIHFGDDVFINGSLNLSGNLNMSSYNITEVEWLIPETDAVKIDGNLTAINVTADNFWGNFFGNFSGNLTYVVEVNISSDLDMKSYNITDVEWLIAERDAVRVLGNFSASGNITSTAGWLIGQFLNITNTIHATNAIFLQNVTADWFIGNINQSTWASQILGEGNLNVNSSVYANYSTWAANILGEGNLNVNSSVYANYSTWAANLLGNFTAKSDTANNSLNFLGHQLNWFWNQFVNRTGDTMTGDLNISTGTEFVNLSASQGSINVSNEIFIGYPGTHSRIADGLALFMIDRGKFVITNASGSVIVSINPPLAWEGDPTFRFFESVGWIPLEDGRYDIGYYHVDEPRRWRNAYFSGTINAGDINASDIAAHGDIAWNGVISGDVGWGNLTNVPHHIANNYTARADWANNSANLGGHLPAYYAVATNVLRWNDLTPIFVNRTGDTMTGDLNITGALNASAGVSFGVGGGRLYEVGGNTYLFYDGDFYLSNIDDNTEFFTFNDDSNTIVTNQEPFYLGIGANDKIRIYKNNITVPVELYVHNNTYIYSGSGYVNITASAGDLETSDDITVGDDLTVTDAVSIGGATTIHDNLNVYTGSGYVNLTASTGTIDATGTIYTTGIEMSGNLSISSGLLRINSTRWADQVLFDVSGAGVMRVADDLIPHGATGNLGASNNQWVITASSITTQGDIVAYSGSGYVNITGSTGTVNVSNDMTVISELVAGNVITPKLTIGSYYINALVANNKISDSSYTNKIRSYNWRDGSLTPQAIGYSKIAAGFGNLGWSYGDWIGFNTWTDATGGYSNLIALRKGSSTADVSFEARLYKQAADSTSAYSSYKNIVLRDSGTATYLPRWGAVQGQLENSFISESGTLTTLTEDIALGNAVGDELTVADDDPVLTNLQGVGGGASYQRDVCYDTDTDELFYSTDTANSNCYGPAECPFVYDYNNTYLGQILYRAERMMAIHYLNVNDSASVQDHNFTFYIREEEPEETIIDYIWFGLKFEKRLSGYGLSWVNITKPIDGTTAKDRISNDDNVYVNLEQGDEITVVFNGTRIREIINDQNPAHYDTVTAYIIAEGSYELV